MVCRVRLVKSAVRGGLTGSILFSPTTVRLRVAPPGVVAGDEASHNMQSRRGRLSNSMPCMGSYRRSSADDAMASRGPSNAVSGLPVPPSAGVAATVT